MRVFRVALAVGVFVFPFVLQAQQPPQAPLILQVADTNGKVFGTLLQYNTAVRTLSDGTVVAIVFDDDGMLHSQTFYYEDSSCSGPAWVAPTTTFIPYVHHRQGDSRLYVESGAPVQRTIHAVFSSGQCVPSVQALTVRGVVLAFDAKGYTPPFHVIAK